MATKTFSSAARRVTGEPIPFELDGETYAFTPINTTALVMAGFETGAEQLKIQLNWLSAGLSEDDAARIKDRLLDPHDDLALPTVLSVISWLLEEMSGRPTTPSPA